MNLIDWFRARLGAAPSAAAFAQEETGTSPAPVEPVRELAYLSCVDMIARLVSKCEFQTFEAGRPVRGPEWYAWNVSPNRNQNAAQFLAKLIHSLYGPQGAALVVEAAGQLMVADSWTVDERAVVDSVFTGVTVEGLTLEGAYRARDVLYFRLSPGSMRRVTNRLFDTYGPLIAYNARTYQASRARKGVLKLATDSSSRATREDARQQNAILQDKFKGFFGAGDAVLPLYNGQDYQDLSGSRTYTQETTRDLRAMIDDVTTYDARALGLAPALLLGDVAGIEQAVQYTLTSCIDPLADMIAQEINRKRYGREAVLRGDGVHIDTSTLLHADLLGGAASVEKLVSSGVFSVNDVLRKLGEPKIPEAWADEHFVTKNFAAIQEYLKGVKSNGDPAQERVPPEGGGRAGD